MATTSSGYRDRRTAVALPMPARSASSFVPIARSGHRPAYRPGAAVFGAAAVSVLIWAALIDLFI